jgi:cytochrome c-type biogenesis protein CcmH/NrfF
MNTVDPGSQAITLNVVVNPLVNWVWLGFGILAFGTGIALLPESTLSFAMAKLPATEAATTTVALLFALALLGVPRPASAQHMEQPGSISEPKNALDEQLRGEIGCTCGACPHEPLSKCICGQAALMRADLREEIDAGKDHDQIISSLIEKYGGQQFLAAPLDKGFNRMAWLLPYLLGAAGVTGVGFVAIRWQRHAAHNKDAAPAQTEDAAMNTRLDDELRNLD